MKHGRRSLRFNHQVLRIGVILLAMTTGCLNLGGRTTYVQEKPETEGRLRALEIRVDAIESSITTRQSMPSRSAGNGVTADVYEPIAAPPDGSY